MPPLKGSLLLLLAAFFVSGSESVIAKRSGSTSVAHPYPIQWGNLQVTNPLKIMLQTKPGSIFPEICPTGSGSGT